MATRHHHRRVLIRSLFFGNRADEDGMEAVGRGERDFDLLITISRCHIRRTRNALLESHAGWSTLSVCPS